MAAFGPLSALFRDAGSGDAEDGVVDWYRRHLPESGAILDAMCGAGRVLVPLVEAGVKVHGCDASAAMLAMCEARLAAAGREATLYRQELSALNLPFRYVAAYVDAGAFQRIDDSLAAQRALERIRAHLVPPGIVLIDLYVPAAAAHPPGAPAVEIRTRALPDGSKIAQRSEIVVDAEGRRIAVSSRYERRTGRTISAREDETLALTWYDQESIRELAAESGYTSIEILDSPRSADPGERRFALRASG